MIHVQQDLTGMTSNADATRAKKPMWIGARDSIEVACNIEIEQTHDTLHAHVSLADFDVEYGDEVLVHDAPRRIGFGERSVTTSRATIWRATPFARAWTRFMSYFQLTELYEVGFQPKDEIKINTIGEDKP
jgi:hypothetical protein